MECFTLVECADERLPGSTIGVDGPDAPKVSGAVMPAAQALVLRGAEDDSSILEDGRVQRATEVEMADLFDVAAVFVHDEQLRDGIERIDILGGMKGVAVAGEEDLAAGYRAGAHVVNAIGRRL